MRLQGAKACEERLRQRNSNHEDPSFFNILVSDTSAQVGGASFLLPTAIDLKIFLSHLASNDLIIVAATNHTIRPSVDLNDWPAKILSPPSTPANLGHPYSISQRLSVHKS